MLLMLLYSSTCQCPLVSVLRFCFLFFFVFRLSRQTTKEIQKKSMSFNVQSGKKFYVSTVPPFFLKWQIDKLHRLIFVVVFFCRCSNKMPWYFSWFLSVHQLCMWILISLLVFYSQRIFFFLNQCKQSKTLCAKSYTSWKYTMMFWPHLFNGWKHKTGKIAFSELRFRSTNSFFCAFISFLIKYRTECHWNMIQKCSCLFVNGWVLRILWEKYSYSLTQTHNAQSIQSNKKMNKYS